MVMSEEMKQKDRQTDRQDTQIDDGDDDYTLYIMRMTMMKQVPTKAQSLIS